MCVSVCECVGVCVYVTVCDSVCVCGWEKVKSCLGWYSSPVLPRGY